ncbi:hypothetical protein [Polaribacter sp.]|uniref:hypothetical protein n=1 Tax=Polaribacter sp. TaxID=1920175 RepID=UPI003EF46445
MNLKKRVLYAVVILLLLYIANIFISTGFFRKIENSFEGKILKEIKLPGAEDITISQIDSFAIVSSTQRNKFPNTKQAVGGLYFIDLKDKAYKPVLLTNNFKKPFAPHGISIFKKENGYILAAINHTIEGESIEVFQLIHQELTHKKTLRNEMIFSPNDLVLLDENSLYFTNDHGYKSGILRLSEDYFGLSLSNVVFFDGKKYAQVTDGIAHANGINFDKKRNLIFVASPRKFLIKVYYKNKDNSLSFLENIDCKTGVDNIEIDTDGNLWVGSHPNLLHFASYAKGDKETAPSEIIKINYKEKGHYTIEKIFMDDGFKMSASSVAATFGNLIFAGNVMDDKFLILERTSNFNLN